jgi:tryptophan-rich sensory protein
MNVEPESTIAVGHAQPSRRLSILALLLWLTACYVAASMGAIFPPGEWYGSLRKPSWNPPAWIFAPVWTALYSMMATAAWLVWKRGGFTVQRKPLSLFLLQLGLNTLWTPLFFGLHLPGLAFLDILLLSVATAATLAEFRRVSGSAAWLLAPYLAWVCFAAALNCSLWRLNQ